MISIWFFVGCLLTLYGALILAAGLQGRSNPSTNTAEMDLHLQIWWGVGLLVIGLVYAIRFRPKPS